LFDLHTHTVFSDGTTTPERNAELAAAAGLIGIALTDHDTTEGWERQQAACDRLGLQLVPGIELSTERDDLSVHLLGYWVDPRDPKLVDECDRLRNERAHRAGQILQRLSALGVDVSLDRVLAHAEDAPIGRPHVAAAMVEVGAVPDLQTAFDRYLADRGPAWVPKHAVDPVDGVRLLREAGGAVVLAHPGLEDRESNPVTLPLVEELCAAGLHGIEADHAGHEERVSAYWREIARERALLITGSSDFHGTNKDVGMGARTTPASVVDALREHAAATPPT
jgi:3',5'-nucleoside bisphosphate phosphatase